MNQTIKYIELYQYSPTTWWVSYAEERDGRRKQRFDISPNLGMCEAEQHALTRRQVTGRPIYRRHNTSHPLYYRGPFA